MHRPKPVILTILDGWGYRAETQNNAIAQASTPNWDSMISHYPYGLLNASELHVGLPEGQMGNSEVGHMNIGSGRVLMQDLPKIDAAIKDGSLKSNGKLCQFIEKLKASGGVCHLMGLLSCGGVHSQQSHIVALANILQEQGIEVKIHAFLDGRDTPPQSAADYMAKFKAACSAPVATVCGRYYAMDRDTRWERVQQAYDTLVSAKGERYADAQEAIKASYAAEVNDEFVLPCVIGDYQGMADGDGVLMANFRSDRVREILSALLDADFSDFQVSKQVKFSAALGMCEYSKDISGFIPAIFPPKTLSGILGEVVSKAGMKQLRIAETEKYAHVTFFFNGGREEEFAGEERILIPSPDVATYDLKPEMSAYEVTDKLVEAIESDQFDLIVVNYANTDMVGHSGNIEAAKKAVEAVDKCLGRLMEATEAKGGAILVTADHGNAEMMHDAGTQQAHTAHTLNLVPVVIVSEALKGKKMQLPEGKLGDISPTILQLLGLTQPSEMTGHPLLDDYV